MKNRAGFTLIELLVSLALTLFIMAILAQAFVLGTDMFRTLKAVGDLNESLRTAATTIRNDLAADHFEGKRRLSDSKFWIDGPPREGYLALYTPPEATVIEGVDPDGIPSRRCIRTAGPDLKGYILAFTVKAKGNRPQDYYSALAPVSLLGQDGRFEQPGVFNSQWAEICYFLGPRIGQNLPGPQLFALYRQQRLIIGDVDPLNWGPSKVATNAALLSTLPKKVSCKDNPSAPGNFYFNSPADLTIPERRTAGSSLTVAPFINPAPAFLPAAPFINPAFFLPFASGSNKTGEDLLLTDVLSFDVKAMCVPNNAAPGVAVEFTDLPDVPGNPGLKYFDTWSKRVDDKYDYSSTPIPATTYRIVALQITLRVWDSKSQIVRQVTIVQDL